VDLLDYDFIVNIEQQNIYDPPAREKNNAYAYKQLIIQYKRGEKCGTVKKVIQINFVKKFVGLDDLEGTYELSDIENGKKLGDEKVKIMIINVAKYKEKII